MIVVCPTCSARYRFDESKLGGRPMVKTRCGKCKGVIEITAAGAADATLGGGEIPPPPPEPAPTPEPPAPPPASEPPRESTRETPVVDAAEATDPGRLTGRDIEALLELPKGKRFSLAVIQGEATGQIFPVTKVRTMIGRTGADLNIDDPEASRQHAVLEILGEHAVLRDLESTNGTYVDGKRIERQVLGNQMEFRIGGHVLMFIITSTEDA